MSYKKCFIRLMRRWLEHKEPRSYFERKIVWAEGQIRAARGVIWASGAPNDFSRSSEPTTNLLISRMSPKNYFPVVLPVLLASLSFAMQRQRDEWNSDRSKNRLWS